jgi:hypothetical protein
VLGSCTISHPFLVNAEATLCRSIWCAQLSHCKASVLPSVAALSAGRADLFGASRDVGASGDFCGGRDDRVGGLGSGDGLLGRADGGLVGCTGGAINYEPRCHLERY